MTRKMSTAERIYHLCKVWVVPEEKTRFFTALRRGLDTPEAHAALFTEDQRTIENLRSQLYDALRRQR